MDYQGLADPKTLMPLTTQDVEIPECAVVNRREGEILYLASYRMGGGFFYRCLESGGIEYPWETFGEVAAAVRLQRDLAAARRNDPKAAVLTGAEIEDARREMTVQEIQVAQKVAEHSGEES